jgi:hypothetical protein
MVSFTVNGSMFTGFGAFGFVWLLNWTRGGSRARLSLGRIVTFLAVSATIAALFFSWIRRQWLQYLRQQILEATSAMTSNLQELDAAALAAITLIQEVELVSRGYRM